MAKFRIATPAGASFSVAGGGYGYEMEALTPIDAEIYEIPAGSEEEFVAAAKDADALYAKGLALVKLGRRTDGADEFAELIKRFPKSDLAAKACDQRKNMGLSRAVPRGGAAKKR